MRPRPVQEFRIADDEDKDRFRWLQPLPSLLVLVACLAISYISAWAYDAPIGADDPRRLIVSDGDAAQGVGVVVPTGERRAVLCPVPPAAAATGARPPGSGPGGPAGGERADAACAGGVRVTGLDPATLDGAALAATGGAPARLRGTWRDGALRVAEVRAATPAELAAARPAAPRVPCATPAGGWPVAVPAGTADTGSGPDRGPVDRRLATIADRVRAPYVATAPGPGGEPVDVVVVVVTRGDAAAERADLTPRYAGNLCVARGVGVTLADTTQARARLATIGGGTPLAITDGANGLDVAIPVLTRELHDDIAATAGFGAVDVRPLVQRVPG